MKANTERSPRNHSMVNALHSKASYWIRQGIFDQLRSFEAFEARINEIPEEKDRGDIFEIFLEGYLANSDNNAVRKALGRRQRPAIATRAIQAAK
jgi:hypothetical protein